MRWVEIAERAAAAAVASGRLATDVKVVAVSKGQSVQAIQTAYDEGARDFGENRAQELANKAPVLPQDIRWHFVGHLQRNKVRLVRPVAFLLHSLDRDSLGYAWLKGPGPPPPVLLQVNIDDEEQKSGFPPSDVLEAADAMASIGLGVRGLMVIPRPPGHGEDSRAAFARLAALGGELRARFPSAAELSMGMSEDFSVAIEEGATIVRVGQAIFGPRART